VRSLTVLADSGCGLCAQAAAWLERQDQLVPLRFVQAGSEEARRRFPGLDVERTRRELAVVSDDGAVWWGDRAFVICLWALDRHRARAVRLARRGDRAALRRAFLWISRRRKSDLCLR